MFKEVDEPSKGLKEQNNKPEAALPANSYQEKTAEMPQPKQPIQPPESFFNISFHLSVSRLTVQTHESSSITKL